jgi:hypothetical protein
MGPMPSTDSKRHSRVKQLFEYLGYVSTVLGLLTGFADVIEKGPTIFNIVTSITYYVGIFILMAIAVALTTIVLTYLATTFVLKSVEPTDMRIVVPVFLFNVYQVISKRVWEDTGTIWPSIVGLVAIAWLCYMAYDHFLAAKS